MAKRKTSATQQLPPVECDSLADVDALLLQLGEIEALETQTQAAYKEAETAAKLKFKERLFVDVEGERVSCEDRRRQISEALELWASARRDEILIDGLKSRKLNHGTIGWRKAADAVTNIEGQPVGGNKTALEKIAGHLQRALKKFAELIPGVLECLSIKVTWSKDKLTAAVTEGKIAATDLRPLGFRLVRGEDEFFAEPDKRGIVSTSEGK